MSHPAQNVLFLDSIEGTADITEKTYTDTRIKRLDIHNDGLTDIVLSLTGKTVTIKSNESWGYYVDIDKFSVAASSNAYRISVGV